MEQRTHRVVDWTPWRILSNQIVTTVALRLIWSPRLQPLDAVCAIVATRFVFDVFVNLDRRCEFLLQNRREIGFDIIWLKLFVFFVFFARFWFRRWRGESRAFVGDDRVDDEQIAVDLFPFCAVFIQQRFGIYIFFAVDEFVGLDFSVDNLFGVFSFVFFVSHVVLIIGCSEARIVSDIGGTDTKSSSSASLSPGFRFSLGIEPLELGSLLDDVRHRFCHRLMPGLLGDQSMHLDRHPPI